MVPNITAIVQHLTGEWTKRRQPDASLAVCREIGSTAERDRVLTPVTTTTSRGRTVFGLAWYGHSMLISCPCCGGLPLPQ